MAKVFLSLGTNIDRDHNLKCGLDDLYRLFGNMQLSSLFESQAVGFEGSAFYNMVIEVNTELPLNTLASALREIEFSHGREHNAKKFSPRTLDIDILLYDDIVCDFPVQLPRKEIAFNAFVLWPLSELAADLIHPVIKKSYKSLWQEFDKSSQQLEIIPLSWQIPKEVNHS